MRQNERDATVIWLWNKLESNMSPLTPKVHSQGSLSKFTLKVLGKTEGSKLSDSVDILSRFTLKVLGNTEGSKLSDSVDMYTYDVTDQLKHYCSPSGPSQSPTHTHTRSIFFLSAQQMRVLTAFVAANSLPGIELTSKLLLPVFFLPLPAPRSDSLF